MCDVKLAVDNVNAKQNYIIGHSLVLSAGSKFFYNYFVRRNACNMDTSDIIQLSNVSAEVLNVTVDFIYGKLPINDSEISALKIGGEVFGVLSAKQYIATLKTGWFSLFPYLSNH